MSSGFVPAGHVPSPSDATTTTSTITSTTSAAPPLSQQQPPPPPPPADDNRSLYAILQSNAAAKQAEFEEKLKFKNQFKPLDENDVEYLDSVVEGERRAREMRRREEEERVESFRALQGVVDRAEGVVVEEEGVEGGWKKRKRPVKVKVNAKKGGPVEKKVKEMRKGEGEGEGEVEVEVVVEGKEQGEGEEEEEEDGKATVKPKETSPLAKKLQSSPPIKPVAKPPPLPPLLKKKKPALLVDYGSDEDSD